MVIRSRGGIVGRQKSSFSREWWRARSAGRRRKHLRQQRKHQAAKHRKENDKYSKKRRNASVKTQAGGRRKENIWPGGLKRISAAALVTISAIGGLARMLAWRRNPTEILKKKRLQPKSVVAYQCEIWQHGVSRRGSVNMLRCAAGAIAQRLRMARGTGDLKRRN